MSKSEFIDSLVMKPIRLKFMVGEVTLFSLTLESLVLSTHFTSLGTDPDTLYVTIKELFPKVSVIFMPSHPVEACISNLKLLSEAIRYVPKVFNRYYISIEGTFEEYLNTFSSKSRSTLLRKVRKFKGLACGEICFRVFRRPEEMLEFCKYGAEISAKTYQERLLGAGLPRSGEFVKGIQRLAESDMIRGYILFLKDNPVSYLLCPGRDEVLAYEYVGYDPEYKKWSPGTVLQYFALESIFSEGKFKLFDFTEGEGDHKNLFSNGKEVCGNVYYFRRTILNIILIAVHYSLNSGTELAGKVLGGLGLKSKIKKLIRAWR